MGIDSIGRKSIVPASRRSESGVFNTSTALRATLVGLGLFLGFQFRLLSSQHGAADVLSLTENATHAMMESFTGQVKESADDKPIGDGLFPLEPKPRPPLDSIVQGWEVVGDAQWLLNVAVVGFPKCATSTLMFQLKGHPEMDVFGAERCDLGGNQQVTLMRDLYAMPQGDIVRGIKCPQNLESTGMALPTFQKYFPKTDFIVGIRHPVLWFESFYNFRVHNRVQMPAAEKLVGNCGRGMHSVCTHRGNFHFWLSNLGKTNNSDPEERKYMRKDMLRYQTEVYMPNKVFLYEVTQLSDENDQREAQFREDLQNFLHLREPIPKMMWFKPGMAHSSADTLKHVNSLKIDICEDKFADLRAVLMEQGINTTRWLREFFLESDEVVVSSKEHFINEILPAWERDPCLDREREDSIEN